MDYLNLIIRDPSTFIRLADTTARDRISEFLNWRIYDALGGTCVHLVVNGLIYPSPSISFDDYTAFTLIETMVESGANLFIEDCQGYLPYELFSTVHEDKFKFLTFRYLLHKMTELSIEHRPERNLYSVYRDAA